MTMLSCVMCWVLFDALQEGRARIAAAMQVDQPLDAQPVQQQEPPTQAGTSDPQQQQQQQQLAIRGGRCRYSPLPRVIKLAGAPAAQLTALNVDKTTLLEQVITRYQPATIGSSSGVPSQQQQQQQQGLEVVGELQFAFIAFVFGQSLEGEHTNTSAAVEHADMAGESSGLAGTDALVLIQS
jgi:hypothetical protein